MAAAFLASTIVIAVVTFALDALLMTRPWDVMRWTSFGAIAGLCCSLALVRTSWPEGGAFLACAILLATIGILHAQEDDNSFVYFLAVPIGTAAVILPPRGTHAVLGLLAVLAVADLALDDNTAHGIAENIEAYSFLGVMTGLAIAFNRINERHLRELEATTSKLQNANSTIQQQDRNRVQVLQQLAHDLASPLTPVLLSLRLLRNQGVEAKRLDVIERNLAHQRRLIGDVGDLARLEGGQLTIRREETDLTRLAQDAVESLRSPAQERSVHLHLESPGNIRALVDPGRISQVLVNLVTNAMKFTPPGKAVHVRLSETPAQVVVKVEDEGLGMTAEQLAKLFKPFSQVHDPSSVKRPEDKGTGLGLSICKGLVEAHGGTIHASSAGPNQGSTFTLKLPKGSAVDGQTNS